MISGPAGIVRPGQWYHLAVTYTSGTAPRIFVNGAEASYLTHNAGSGSDADESTGNLLIGSWNHGGTRPTGDRLDGVVDDVRIYNRALSPQEVRELYRLGRGGVLY